MKKAQTDPSLSPICLPQIPSVPHLRTRNLRSECVYTLLEGTTLVKINDDHLYHGAALTQIAEDDEFTAINPLDLLGKRSNSAFRINDNIGVYLKYDSVGPKGTFKEFKFTFTVDHLKELEEMAEKLNKVFIVLLCLKARGVCVITLDGLKEMVAIRQNVAGQPESQYQVLVTAPKNSKLRVYVNKPNTKGKQLGTIKVARNAFPSFLFQ